MSEVTVEYVAGFFDADGTVGNYDTNGRGWRADRLRFINCNKDLLLSIQKKFLNGKIYLTNNHLTKGKNGKNWSKCWHLQYNGRYGIALAKSIYPFLHIKKEKLGKFIERNEKNAERI